MTELGLLQFGDAAGCACKADWDVVEAIRGFAAGGSEELGLLDATVISSRSGIRQVASIDFIGPIARDASDYGAIAAAHALSDLYAVGARPISALAIAAWPRFEQSTETLTRAMAAMRESCASIGCAISGGHTVVSQQPLLGLSVLGEIARPASSLSNFVPGDRIYLTKRLGSGIVIGAVKESHCTEGVEHEAVECMKRHNVVGLELNLQSKIKMVTDITGYGLCGQLSRLAQLSGFSIQIEAGRVPVFGGVEDLVSSFRGTHAAERNLAFMGPQMNCRSWLHSIVMSDPQTNGPLLFVCDDSFDPFVAFDGSSVELEFYNIGKLGEARPGVQIDVL